MQRVNAFLRGESATLVLLALALLAQGPHAATVFHRLAPPTDGAYNILGWMHAGAYAIALELATFIFVVRGQRALSWVFAGVSVAVNFAYYLQPDLSFADMLRAALISIALPASIAFYSHSVANHLEGEAHVEKPTETKPTETKAEPTTPETPVDAPDADARQRALLLASDGLTATQIATELNKNPSTVRSWLRRAATQNGVAH